MNIRIQGGGRHARAIRRTSTVLAALALTSVTAVACGSDDSSDTPAAASATPVAGGKLTYATVQEPSCIDPGYDPSTVTGVIDRNIFDSLVSQTATGETKPWLATSWTVSPDGKTYRFSLRDGVTFHDGTAFDGAAVKATFDHAVDPETKSLYAAALLSAYQETRVIDPRTIEVVLTRPNASFLQSVGSPFLGIQSPASLERSAEELCTKPVGSGAFTFVSWTKNRDLVLAKNPAYQWAPDAADHDGPAYLDGITFQFISDDTARFGALTSGQVNVINNVPAANIRALKANGSLQYLRADSPGLAYSLILNTGREPLSDVRVRRALLRSVNLDALVESVYFGEYNRAWSLLSPTTIGYDKSLEGTWKFDAALANKLLDEAGWTQRDGDGFRTKDGKRLTIVWRTGAQLDRDGRGVVAQGVQADAKKVGIDLQYISEDVGTFSQHIFAGDLDIWGGNYQRPDGDILRFAFASDQGITKGGGNLFGLQDPTLDRLLNEASTTTDEAVREKNWADAQQYVIDNALAVPLTVGANLVGASNKVQGLRFEQSSNLTFFDTWLDPTK
ncbi:ABC transporter substrate-binding protein [Frankia sp. CNm7]|uniref:ABC transporter substrate-binding protein n=1 Tax=Frankia nepalensis TaxID=1836974 RepID=A0A937UVI4_9ACTN|nr:ABC transporter substrate-binding protein [Frankia nepalensis]MBL7497598.1 ABC transporter substrate-binding protein [Frankia nepalensis]MBL7511784.1 ABC transporter substrate-binding protein [Frankia nepalensis]MBL7523992.1 ABC transporter substrate-binding protein [Frankia nepalensis]MBL7633270.1 ABC transporter substrate-binding protein [Frankia nepalensis]